MKDVNRFAHVRTVGDRPLDSSGYEADDRLSVVISMPQTSGSVNRRAWALVVTGI
jgi:hypothetical protein